MTSLVRASLLSVALATLASAASLSHAQTAAPTGAWPQRTVRFVVPFPPGGGTDTVARALGQKLSARLDKPVVVDNKPGASTIIGTEAVVRAEPDGYTLLVSGSSSYTVNPALRSKLPYDLAKDLIPVATVARAPLVMVVSATAPYKDLHGLIAAAKAAPKTIHYATFGSGSGPHLAGALLEQAAGIKLQDVPYRGSSQSLMALIGGEIQLGIDTVAAAAPQIRAGKLRALAIAGKSRSSMLPGVPTVEELKLPDAVFDAWYAIAAPAKTPPEVIRKLVAEVEAITRDPGMQEQVRAQGMEPVHLGPVATRAVMDDEIGRYRALAHRAQIVVE
ncbi:MAG: tripartite tricarboxylate transporter substrate binding protein [Gammaproteobacteria bacterium]|jgi:tripartite-type tricarboxylate transporter receptor subunit TctC|nr:tripartite tricarboxylate transporter substrate binding protein [Gammaproteobacteria bacterium]